MTTDWEEFPLSEMEAKLAQIKLKEERIKLREELPFLHGWKWYPWAREFFESRNKLNLLCAANQISKSSTQIRKCIDWATNQEKWSDLWIRKPVQFWYLYPTQKQVDAEFATKWQQFLPRGSYKESGAYAWKVLRKNKEVVGIHFTTADVYVFFKTYAQDVSSLQTGTADALFCDEELPVDLYDELIFRVSASDGYFHMVFTATLGQEFWREVIEERGEREKLVGAAKWQISMYDCIKYEDGSRSHWTEEKIQIVKNRCKTHNEVLRRVYGRFVVDSGRKYEQFDLKRHMIAPRAVPQDWLVYAGVDTGSGGVENHPAAICFVAVKPDFRYGEVFMGWRGDGKDTTASDILLKFIKLKNGRAMCGQYYDWADKDFDMISTRMHEPFQKADKSHDKGEEVINVLFKNNMLFIHTDSELEKLSWELSNLRLETNKRKAKDDFTDAMRYALTRIPWDWSAITGDAPEWTEEKPTPNKTEYELQVEERRAEMKFEEDHELEIARIEDEIEEYNGLYEG